MTPEKRSEENQERSLALIFLGVFPEWPGLLKRWLLAQLYADFPGAIFGR